MRTITRRSGPATGGGRPTVLEKIQAPRYRPQRTAVYKYTHGTQATCGRQVGWDEETRDEKTKGRSAHCA